MKSKLQIARGSLRWEWWQFLYVLLSLSWLLGPSLNHHLSAQGSFISHFEDAGQPWAWLYRLCDSLAAIALGLAVWFIARRQLTTKFQRASLALLATIAVGSLIDVTISSRPIHSIESVITTSALLGLNAIWAYKRMAWARPVLIIQLVWSLVFLVNQFAGRPPSSLVQFTYQITVTLWVASIVPRLAGWKYSSKAVAPLQAVVHVIAAWAFFGGFIAVVNSVGNLGEISELSSAYFGSHTAWLSQHGVVIGIVLMYISRHLWRGEYRAWQLASLLLWLEAFKYAVLTPDYRFVLLYGVTASVLFALRGLFDRYTSVTVLQERLKQLALVITAVLVALVIGVISFRLKRHQDVDSLKFNPAQFIRHLFLVDVVNDLGPLPRRLLGQVLNVAGLGLLLTFVVSLFRPRKPLHLPLGQQERRRLLILLHSSSNSAEDYFKYWPQPKSYWWNQEQTAVVCYRVTGNVAFALADPVTSTDKLRQAAAKQFLEYCRQQGWRACFLMVSPNGKNLYRKQGYKLMRIGASAVVNIDDFCTETSRNKWWRWVLNKARKQQWEYQLAIPPHSPKLMSKLRQTSDIWLQRDNHKEHGFGLGYFDNSYIQSCRLHLLTDHDTVIAFANELPVFNHIKTTTIDLMRFLPDHKHAMPILLARTIQQLEAEGIADKFDLGFVPLASPTAKTEQVIQKLGQLLMSEAFSVQGLEQFKGKFAPVWNDNYLAFDGDWIDLLNISRQLDNLLRP